MAIENTTKKPRPEWLFGGDPESIERQEAQGQAQIVASAQLPVRGLDPEHAAKYNIQILVPSADDSLFADVKLPAGMTKRGTDHSMWSELVAEDGTVIATIFYKAAFYDRSAFIRWSDDEA